MVFSIVTSMAVALLAVLAVSALPLVSKNARLAVAGEAVSRGGVLLLLVGGACFLLPMFIPIFDEFGIEVPAITTIWLQIGKALMRMPARIGGLLAACLAAEVSVYAALLTEEETRWRARVYSGVLTVLMTLAVVSFLLAMCLPYLQLLEGLS